ncbi:heat shock protein HSP20 [Candidatus Magnetomorum sp. HK-1]|nr:heat shock protein HSP20 [Candidatus Magnetomorum sp. HK-1]
MAITRLFHPTGYNRLYHYNLLQNEMNQLFDSFFGNQKHVRSAGFPALNVSQDNDNLYVRAELPGIDVNDIEINTDIDTLHIKGKRIIEDSEKNVRYHRRERGSGEFNRTIHLPFAINTEKVSAEMKLGVLSIKLPKADEAKPRKISIKTV